VPPRGCLKSFGGALAASGDSDSMDNFVQSDSLELLSPTVSSEELALKLWQHLKGILEDSLEMYVENAIQKVMSKQRLTVAEHVHKNQKSPEITHHDNIPKRDLSDFCAVPSRATSLPPLKVHNRHATTEVIQRLNAERIIDDECADRIFNHECAQKIMNNDILSLSSGDEENAPTSHLGDGEHGLMTTISPTSTSGDEANTTEECSIPGCVDLRDSFGPSQGLTSLESVRKASDRNILFSSPNRGSTTSTEHVDPAKFVK